MIKNKNNNLIIGRDNVSTIIPTLNLNWDKRYIRLWEGGTDFCLENLLYESLEDLLEDYQLREYFSILNVTSITINGEFYFLEPTVDIGELDNLVKEIKIPTLYMDISDTNTKGMHNEYTNYKFNETFFQNEYLLSKYKENNFGILIKNWFYQKNLENLFISKHYRLDLKLTITHTSSFTPSWLKESKSGKI